MQSFIFHLRQLLYFLGDSVFFPFRVIKGLWLDDKRGRILLFGLPSVMMFLFAVVCALLAFGSQGSLKREYDAARRLAQKENDRAAAIVYTQKLMQLDPSDTVKYELATLLISDDSATSGAQNRLRAQSMFDSLAPDDRPGYPDAHVRKAKIFAAAASIPREQRIELIENQLNLALVTDATNSAALEMSAELLAFKGDYEEALEIYTSLFKDNVGFHRKIAEIYSVMGRGNEARSYVNEAIERYTDLLTEQPGNVDHIRRIANAHAMLGDFDKAIDFMNAAIADEPDTADQELLKKAKANIHILRAQTFVQADFVTDEVARNSFLDDIIDAYRLDPTNEPSMRLLAEFADGGFPESSNARDVYDPRINPENADDTVLQGIGTRELMLGNREKGISLLQKGLQKNPENHAIMNNLAYALIEEDLSRAEKLSEQSIRTAPNVANYYDTHGTILIEKGEYEKAISEFDKAIGLGLKNNPKLFRSLSLCYEKLGMVEDSESYLRRAEEIEKTIQQ